MRIYEDRTGPGTQWAQNEYSLNAGKAEEGKKGTVESFPLTWFKSLLCIHSLDLLPKTMLHFLISSDVR